MDASFAALLRPGERIVWSGAPAQGLRFTPRDLFLVPFALIWCSVAVPGVFASTRGSDPLPFKLFGLLFVVIGFMALIGRFAVDAALRARTRYALTDRRVLIERSGPGAMLHTIDLAGVVDIALSPGRNGRGTIRLGPKSSLFWHRGNGLDIWVPALDPTPQLLAIPDARRVFDLIQRGRERVA